MVLVLHHHHPYIVLRSNKRDKKRIETVCTFRIHVWENHKSEMEQSVFRIGFMIDRD